VTHPVAVARMVDRVPGRSDAMVQAALLHDVVEDTPVTLQTIHDEFGHDVGDLVHWLTNPPKVKGENRVAKKASDVLRLSKAPWSVQTIKLADRLHNLPSTIEFDPPFAAVYVGETKLLLTALSEGDPTLWHQLHEVVQRYREAKR